MIIATLSGHIYNKDKIYLPGNPLLSDSVIFWEKKKKKPSKALSEATGGDRALGRGAQAF